MSYKFVFLPPASDRHRQWAEAIRAALPDLDVSVCPDWAAALGELAEARGAFGTLDAELLAAASELQWLAAPAAGPRPQFYFPELVASDVTVTNIRGIYSDHISAQIMSYVLAFARGLHVYIPLQVEGVWAQGEQRANTIFLPEATAVVIGVGGIGAETARHLDHFGVHVIGVDPRVESPPPGVRELIRPDALDDHIGRGDFVIMTAPQTPSTQGMMNAALIGKMKQTAILINIGRGSNVSLDDLADALDEGRIGGAALDVFATEPLPADHRLWKAPNFLLTPHMAGDGPYLDDRRRVLLIENCRRLRDGEELLNIVDKANWF
ncbi:MAG: D-2-hydroxyacid dehydrogenase [Candidatus Latescibacteria bacterium]|jgi:phosphoglycerate dehydrogenase-like enzyme|nr:D-2-hydroxyacid dehydrogenase [Candidatus Latescibacterota bacterium]